MCLYACCCVKARVILSVWVWSKIGTNYSQEVTRSRLAGRGEHFWTLTGSPGCHCAVACEQLEVVQCKLGHFHIITRQQRAPTYVPHNDLRP